MHCRSLNCWGLCVNVNCCIWPGTLQHSHQGCIQQSSIKQMSTADDCGHPRSRMCACTDLQMMAREIQGCRALPVHVKDGCMTFPEASADGLALYCCHAPSGTCTAAMPAMFASWLCSCTASFCCPPMYQMAFVLATICSAASYLAFVFATT